MEKNELEALRLARLYCSWLTESTIWASPHTIASYKESFRCLMRYLEDNKGLDTGTFCSDSGFSKPLLTEWVAHMADMGMKPQTCNLRLSAVRAFLKYVASRDVTYRKLYMEVCEVRGIRNDTAKVLCMSKKAVKTILSIPDIGTDAGYRDVILMSLAYSTGCRIDETLSLTLSNVRLDIAEPYIMVNGKGNKHRTLYLNSKMAGNLKKYILKFHANDSNDKRLLFYSKVKGPYEKLSHESIRKRLKSYAAKAHERCCEVPLDLHMHHFRHAMALHRLEDGMNIEQLSTELGHENIQTTMIYLNVKPGMKEKAIMQSQSKNIRHIPKKWKDRIPRLTDLFR